MKNIRKGFTMIEVLAVMVIIAMATLVSIPQIDTVMDHPKNLKVMTDLKSYEFAILELHYAKEPITASSISNIVDSELEFTLGESKGENPYGNEYKLKQNGPDDVTIESLKSGSRIIDVVQSLHAYKSGTKMIIDYENIDESLSSEIIVDRTASTPQPANVTDYYDFMYDPITGGYRISINAGFKMAIINKTSYKDWVPGQPLPNPGNSFNSKIIKSYESLFEGLTTSEIDVSLFQTETITTTQNMFKDCTSKIIGIKEWRLNSLEDASRMFKNYNNTSTEIVLSGKFVGNPGLNIATEMFYGAVSKSVDLTGLNMDKLDNVDSMFELSDISTINIGNITNTRLVGLTSMFKDSKLKNLYTGDIAMMSVNNLNNTFSVPATELDLSKLNLNTATAWTVSNPFKTGTDSTYYLKDMATINKFRAIPGLCENSTITLKPTNMENYYKYTLVEGGYAVSLTDGFKSALTEGKSYEKWTYETPLPNPGKIYNNKPVISYNGTFMGLKITTLDLSLWDMNNVRDTTAMFKGSEIANLIISYWKSTKAPMLSISQMFQNAKIANVPSIGNMTIDEYTSAVDVFTGSTMTQLKVHAAMLSMWKNYKTATTEVILA